MKLFALGTLKRGFPLHEKGLGGVPCLGAYRTIQPYPMLVAGPWFAPMLLDQPGTGHRVLGELYEVDEPRLALLDEMESVGTPGNLRVLVDVEPLAEGARTSAFAYAKAAHLAVPAHSGFLEDYQDRRFIPPWQRP